MNGTVIVYKNPAGGIAGVEYVPAHWASNEVTRKIQEAEANGVVAFTRTEARLQNSDKMADLLESIVDHCQPPALAAEGMTREAKISHLDRAREILAAP